MNDLLGHPISESAVVARPKRPKKTGHAAPSGSGPAGMTCRQCEHLVRTRIRSGKTFSKCALMRHAWTHGGGSDIKQRDPACNRFMPEREEVVVA